MLTKTTKREVSSSLWNKTAKPNTGLQATLLPVRSATRLNPIFWSRLEEILFEMFGIFL
jgi:hypothetical protein